MRLPSARQHNFAAQPTLHAGRSAFDRRHSNSFTFNGGDLVPFFHEHVALPGDTINMSASFFARLNTPYFPIMTNVYMMVHYWAVPHRLLWTHWVNFMGETVDPWVTDPTPTVYMTPISTIPAGGYAVGSLQDYFALPVTDGVITCEGLEHNVFLMRAYNLTWNTSYRDQNLQDPVVVDTGDGPDTVTNYTLLKRGKRHDYFTSCLPFAQKGDPVGIGLTGNAPVYGDGQALGLTNGTTNYGLTSGTSTITVGTAAYGAAPATSGGVNDTGANDIFGVVTSGNSGLIADLASVTAITINEFRSAFLAQELLEVDARGGTRYPEMIYAHFNVTNPDSRMQYPEYLGGAVFPLDITSVPQTSGSGIGSETTPQGNLAAFGTFSGRNIGFIKSFTEHSVVFGLLCVYSDITYSQGLSRHYSARTRLDYYMPVLANLGEQAVLNKEIYAQGTAGGTDDDDTFGYQERWAEYRYMPNRVGGLFRPHVANTLAAWNLSQDFAALPVLGSEFIELDDPWARVIVVDSEPDFKVDCYMHMTHVRPMPVQSIPVRLGAGGRRFF